MKFLIGSLVLAIIVSVFSFIPFVLMVVMGALGHSFDNPALYISFWQSFLIVFVLSIIGSFFRGK